MKILVIGATGMLGHKMLQILSQAFPNSVYGSVRKSSSELQKFNLISNQYLIENMDAEKPEEFMAQLNILKPNYVINCTGITLRKADHSLTEKNYNINSFFPRLLADWAEAHQARLIHFSTDCVFDGTRGSYSEFDFPSARDVYGRSKYLGEVSSSNALTLRVSIVGRELFQKTELLEWFLAQKNKTISGYSNVYYTGLTTNFLAREVVRIIQNFSELSGLYQVSSEKISKFDLLQLANKVFANQSLIQNDSSKISDKSLNCDRYIAQTQFIKPNWTQMLNDLVSDPFQYEKV